MLHNEKPSLLTRNAHHIVTNIAPVNIGRPPKRLFCTIDGCGPRLRGVGNGRKRASVNLGQLLFHALGGRLPVALLTLLARRVLQRHTLRCHAQDANRCSWAKKAIGGTRGVKLGPCRTGVREVHISAPKVDVSRQCNSACPLLGANGEGRCPHSSPQAAGHVYVPGTSGASGNKRRWTHSALHWSLFLAGTVMCTLWTTLCCEVLFDGTVEREAMIVPRERKKKKQGV